MEIKKLSETVSGKGNFILYGPSGSGKTFSLSTLPESETLILAVEKGLRTLTEIAPNIDVVQIDAINDMREAFEFLNSGEHGYNYVAVDSLSELSDIALDEAKERSKDGRKHYSEMADIITAIIKSFESLPQTVIFTAQEERVNQEDAGILDYVIAPSIPGRKFAQKVPYKLDFVFCLRTHANEDGDVDRRIQTGMHGDYLAKARSQNLDIFESSDWQEIFEKLKGGN